MTLNYTSRFTVDRHTYCVLMCIEARQRKLMTGPVYITITILYLFILENALRVRLLWKYFELRQTTTRTDYNAQPVAMQSRAFDRLFTYTHSHTFYVMAAKERFHIGTS